MPILGSQITSVPPGISRPAMPMAPMGGIGGMMGMMQGPGSQEQSIFDRVVRLLMSAPQLWLPVLAGLGLSEALEKASKPMTKPHRSNEELSGQGYPTGIPGQTGMPSMGQMVAPTMPPRPPGMPGF